MGQVSRKSNLNPQSVRSKCTLSNLYKAKKHLDQRGRRRLRGEKQKRERETIQLYFHPRIEPKDEHLANLCAISN